MSGGVPRDCSPEAPTLTSRVLHNTDRVQDAVGAKTRVVVPQSYRHRDGENDTCFELDAAIRYFAFEDDKSGQVRCIPYAQCCACTLLRACVCVSTIIAEELCTQKYLIDQKKLLLECLRCEFLTISSDSDLLDFSDKALRIIASDTDAMATCLKAHQKQIQQKDLELLRLRDFVRQSSGEDRVRITPRNRIIRRDDGCA